jgi:hypothetical protein
MLAQRCRSRAPQLLEAAAAAGKPAGRSPAPETAQLARLVLQNPEPETVTLVMGTTFDRSHFRRPVAVTVSSEQDRSEWQIEWQNSARQGLSRACECSSALVFLLANPPYLR